MDVTGIQVARVEALAFSPAGDLAIASSDCVHLVSASGTARIAASEITCVAFRDAKTLAIATKEAGVRVVELGGKPRITQIPTTCYWHSMQWSPDGKYIVGAQYEPFITVLDVEAGAELRVLDPDEFDDEGHTAMVFTGDLLVTTAYNKLVRWRWADVIANKAKCRMAKTGVTGHAHVLEVVLLADGSLMTLVDFEERKRYLQRFAPTGEKMGKKIDVEETTWRMKSNGDVLVLYGNDGELRVCSQDGETLFVLEGHIGEPHAMAISRDGKTVAIGGTSVGIWELATGRRLSPR